MGLYQYDSTEDKLNLVAGSTNFSDAPVGAIFPFGGTDIPISFLLCDGSAVSRTDYEDLFNVIGTAFGTGDGSTTFNLPDLREAVPKGAGLTGYTVGNHLDADGLAVGEFLDDRVQEHTHSTSVFSVGAGFAPGNGAIRTDSASGINTGRTGPTTEVKSVGVNYIIKAKQIGMPTDFASAVGDIVVDKNTYSTSETIVGKWIDGKPIYRRCFSGSGRLELFSATLTNADIITNSFCTIKTDNQIMGGLYPLGLSFNPSTGVIKGADDYPTSTYYHVIVEYTKTTD